MAQIDINTSSALDISGLIAQKKLSRADAAGFFKLRADAHEPSVKSFVSRFPEPVTCIEGASGLAGVPIALKDNICIQGKKITCASKILAEHTAVYDATVVARLKRAGLQIVGTTNMDEFAFGSSTEHSCYGPTKNPWDITRVPGGSSGGSTAAVAARFVPLALGSDTGGSIRQPAAFCGVVGLKPTYGRVSRYGLIAFGSSLDQIGPVTTNFIDCAHLLNIISGHDPMDSTSANVAVPDFTTSLRDEVADITIGVPKEYFAQGLDSEIRGAVEGAIEVYKKKKVKFVEITLPHTEYAVAVYYIVASSEASSNLQRFDGVRYGTRAAADNLLGIYTNTRGQGFGDEAKRRIFLGTYSLSSGYYDAYYVRALKVRRLIREDFDKVFGSVDCILTPTAPTAAFAFGEKTKDPLSMYLSDIFTIPPNLAGLPAVSFPCGFTKNNLPIGLQLIGKEFDEATLIRLGYSYQCSTQFHKKIPDIKSA
ncbi:MAG: Asp-tRNA(Asn)/Glu-tRNA(Gln) amidotransferase subunit GatA [Candidatus Omnitrophota bacterium]